MQTALSIRAKFLITFSILTLGIVTVSAYSFVLMQKNNSAFRELREHFLPALLLARDNVNLFQTYSKEVEVAISLSDVDQVRERSSDLEVIATNLKTLADYKFPIPVELKDGKTTLQAFSLQVEQFVQSTKVTKSGTANTVESAQNVGAARQLFARLFEQMQKQAEQDFQEKLNGAMRSNRDSTVFFSVFLAILTLLVVSGSYLLLYSIIARLRSLSAHFASADLNTLQALDHDDVRDELGSLIEAANRMLLSFRESRSALVEKEFVDKILNTLVDMVLVFDASNTIIKLNPTTLAMLDFRSIDDLNGNFRAEMSDGSNFAAALDLTRSGNVIQRDGFLADAKGDLIPVVFTMAPMTFQSSNQTSVVVTAHDVRALRNAEREKQAMEAKLAQAAKLASLGTLGAGVAHELNNPLLAVKGFAEVLNAESRDEGVREYAQKIIKASIRMQKITDHLRTFSADTSGKEMELINVNEVIRDALILFEQRFRNHNVEVDLHLDRAIPRIKGDHNQLEGVFQNLFSNSFDSFGSHGEVALKRITVNTRFIVEEQQVEVCFKDNAGGIPESVQKRIFDPFFTTKEVGKGTGLGLSISHSTILRHKGTIELCPSEPGTTLFRVRILAAEAPGAHLDVEDTAIVDTNAMTPSEAPKAEQRTGPAKSRKILIIDDEPMVLELLNVFLKKTFSLTTTQNPAEGIDLAMQQEFDLVITDMRMPGLSGIDVVRAIRAQKPDQLIAIMTGHAKTEEDVAQVMQLGASCVFPKPLPSKAAFIKETQDLIDSKKKQKQTESATLAAAQET